MANWRPLAAQLTKLGFQIGGDLRKDVTLKLAPGGGTYNPTTGDTSAGATPDVTIKGFKVRTEEQQRHDDTGRQTTFILQQADVLAAGFVGQIKETAQAVCDGDIYEVLIVKQDPAGATWQLVAQIPT